MFLKVLQLLGLGTCKITLTIFCKCACMVYHCLPFYKNHKKKKKEIQENCFFKMSEITRTKKSIYFKRRERERQTDKEKEKKSE